MLVEKIINKKENHIILPIGVEASLVIEDRENVQYIWYIRYDDFSEVVKLDEKTNSLTIPKFHKVKSFQYICNVFNDGKEEKYVIDVDIVRLFSENIPVKQECLLGEKVSLKLDVNKKIEQDITINWQKYNEDTNEWEIVSEQKILEIIPKTPTYENKKYRAIVKYDEFKLISKTYNICWNKIIKEQHISKGILFAGDKLKLQVELVDNLNEKITYAWQYKEGNGKWQYLNYATKKSYTVRSELLEYVITYIRCEIKYGDKCIYTDPCEIIYLKRGKHSFAIEPVKDIVTAKIGSNTYLEVIMKSDKPVKYMWEKFVNEEYVELGSQYSDKILSFKNIRMADAGRYRCTAFSEDESITSEDIELKVISDYQMIDAKALIVVDRNDDKIINAKEIYYKVAFKGIAHFENIIEATEHLEFLSKITIDIEKYSHNVINNINLKENDSVSIKDLIYLDIFLHKNDAIRIIEDLFDDPNREYKLVDLFGVNRKIANVSLLNLTNIVNEFIKFPNVYEVLMTKSYVTNIKNINEIINKNLFHLNFENYNLDMFFRSFECNSETLSTSICKLNDGREYLIILVAENEEICFDETVKLVKYTLC